MSQKLQEIYKEQLEEKYKKENNVFAVLRNFYSDVYDNRKKLKKALNIAAAIVTAILLINSYLYYDFKHFFFNEIKIVLIYFGIKFVCVKFHQLFGKWYILEHKVKETREYIKRSMPRGMKVEGFRGSGKDTTISGMVSVFREDLIQRILDEMEEIETICYCYNFDNLNYYLDVYHKRFMVNTKAQFFNQFITMMESEQCFIKDYYKNIIDASNHIKELYIVKRNVDIEAIQKVKQLYHNGIDKKHFLTLLIRYSMLYIRINFSKNFVVTNQPFLETPHITTLEFSTRYIKIQEGDVIWPWPLVGGVIIFETEADAFYPSVGKSSSAMKDGTRNFKAFFRHLMGEDSIWIQIGQKAKRTEKTLRELDESFISVIENNKIYGGEKRIFFLDKKLAWLKWLKDNFKFKKEKQIKKISLVTQKERQLENSGYITIDIKVSRTDEFKAMPHQFTAKQILNRDKPIYENYVIRLYFHITDCFGRFNTHYLEYLAEVLRKKSAIGFYDLKTWDPDLKLKRKHVIHMGYKVLDDIVGIDRKQIKKEEVEAAKRKLAAKKKEALAKEEKLRADNLRKQQILFIDTLEKIGKTKELKLNELQSKEKS